MINRKVSKALVLAAIAVSFGAIGTASFAADGQFAKTHPRRDEVNDRLGNQNKRIKDEVAEGGMSKAKAARLRREDRHIRREERRMAAKNDGHITKQEQASLNRQENAVSKQIGK
jgi:hypothetical protein